MAFRFLRHISSTKQGFPHKLPSLFPLTARFFFDMKLSRLILLHAERADLQNFMQPATNAAIIADSHLALARVLLLNGAAEDARGHLRSAEEVFLPTIINHSSRKREESRGYGRGAQNNERIVDDKNDTSDSHIEVIAAAIADVRLEIALLSRAPVVFSSQEKAKTLRRQLLAEIERECSAMLEGQSVGHWSSPNPLDVGVRSQFLLKYQARLQYNVYRSRCIL